MDLFELAMRLTTEGEAQMTAVLDSIAAQGAETATALEEVQSAWHGMIGPVVELIAVWEGAELFKHMIDEAAELAVKLERTSQMTGISSERLAELGEAAEMSYVPVEQLQTSFRRLSISLTDMNSRGAQAMKAMGLDIEQFHGDADAALTAISDKFATFKDDANKSALAIEIFGRGGLAMIPLLNNLRETTKAVKDLGQTMSSEQKDHMLQYEQSMIRLKITSDGFARTVADTAEPALKAMADAFTVTLAEGEKFNVVGEVLAGTIRFLASIVLFLKEGFLAIASTLVLVINEVGEFGLTWLRVTKDLITMNPGAMAADWQSGLAIMKSSFTAFTDDVEKDADETRSQLANLFGFGDDTAPKSGKKAPTKQAPKIPEKQKEDETWKYNLKAIRDQIEAEKELYELQVKRVQDSGEQEEEKYAKIKALDAAQLAEVEDLYGDQSREYFEQLKVMESHTEAHNKVLLDMQEKAGRDWLKVQEDKTKSLQKLLDFQKSMSQQAVTDITKTIENTFKAGFEKGGGIGSAMKAFGDTVLQGLGGILVRLGETYIEYGGIMAALAALLPNPFTAGPAGLAIGAALIALGSALGAIGSGGGGGGGRAGPVGAPNAINFGTSINLGANSASTAGGLTPTTPVSVTVIGPNDPSAQRQITQLIANAQRRNL